MTLENYRFREIPEYYDWMYLDGFTPDEILYALHKKMNRQQAEQEELQRAGSPLCPDCKERQHLAGVKGQSP